MHPFFNPNAYHTPQLQQPNGTSSLTPQQMEEIEAKEDEEEIEVIESVEDCKMLLSQMNKQTKECKLKRRWLMGLDLTSNETKRIKKLLPPNDGFLPDSLLRQHDIGYEFLKNNILAFSGESKSRKDLEEESKDERYRMLFNSDDGLKEVFGMLDGMNKLALCCFAEKLTGGSVNFGKSKLNMKRFVQERLQGVLKDKSSNQQLKIIQMSKLLRDPISYHEKCLPELSPSQYYRAAAMRILDGIDDFPIQALSSMHRKLRSVKGYTPQFQSPRLGWSPVALANQVRKKCMKFLSELCEEAPLQLPLANALAVANLTVKLRSRGARLTEFRKVSLEIDALQNDIIKAIWLLDDKKKMSFEKVECLLHSLAPNVQTNRKIRILLRNLLTEYLFECADMDTIPKCLVESLAFVNNRTDEASCHTFSTEDIMADFEGVLSVSSQAKQIVWDFIPEVENDFDIEFANAYMDDMLESDDDYFSDDGLEGANFPRNHIDSNYISDQSEGFGESVSSCLNSPISEGNKRASSGNGIQDMNGLDSLGKSGSQSPSSSREPDENSHSTPLNKYLSIEEACDNSSTVAYHLIGGLLTKFAEVDGLDLDQHNLSYLQRRSVGSSEIELLSRNNVDSYCSLISVLEEQSQCKTMCSFPHSSMKKLKKIMS